MQNKKPDLVNRVSLNYEKKYESYLLLLVIEFPIPISCFL